MWPWATIIPIPRNGEENPLYGWILKNPKPDGSHYDLYTDGLRIYTSIDMRMQQYAGEAVNEHLGGVLQPAFEREKRGSCTGPLHYQLQRTQLLRSAAPLSKNAIKQTVRYRLTKQAGASDEEIDQAFHTPYRMDIFALREETKENGRNVTHA